MAPASKTALGSRKQPLAVGGREAGEGRAVKAATGDCRAPGGTAAEGKRRQSGSLPHKTKPDRSSQLGGNTDMQA